MRYLKKFNEGLNDQDDVKDIFLSLMDICRVNFNFNPVEFASDFLLSINLDYLASPLDQMVVSKFGAKYRPVMGGDQIILELVDGINRCLDFSKITRAEVQWINSGEWSVIHHRADPMAGPGLLLRVFKPDGETNVPVNVAKHKCRYSTELLTDFLEERGDRVRNVKIWFSFDKED